MKRAKTLTGLSIAILIAITLGFYVHSLYKGYQKQQKLEVTEFAAETFLRETPSNVNSEGYSTVEYCGLKAVYSNDWLVNTLDVDTEFGKSHIVAFNINNDKYRVAYSITWYKIKHSQSLDDMMAWCKKELAKQYEGTDIFTMFSNPTPDIALGHEGKSIDYSASLGKYTLNKRVSIFRENGYEFRIEKATDISRESLDFYFEELEQNITLKDIY